MARQHSGQTSGSYIIEDSPQIIQLRKKYIFKLVPMVNPDGVIYGNFRSSIAGVDLNRKWVNPTRFINQEIYSLKNYIDSIAAKICFMIDLHGHSKNLNSFAYACSSPDNISTHIFPLILSKLNNSFSYQQSTFSLQESKKQTARAYFYNLGILNSITIETSFWGYESNNKIQDFSPNKLFKLGRDIIQAFVEYFNRDLKQKFSRKQLRKEIEEKLKLEQKNKKNIDIDYQSDPDPEIDYICELQIELKTNYEQRIKKKTKFRNGRFQKKRNETENKSKKMNQNSKTMKEIIKFEERSTKIKKNSNIQIINNNIKKGYFDYNKILKTTKNRMMSKQQLNMNVINLSAYSYYSSHKQHTSQKIQLIRNKEKFHTYIQIMPSLNKIMMDLNYQKRIKPYQRKRK